MTDEPVPISKYGHCVIAGAEVIHAEDCNCDRDYQEEVDNELSQGDNLGEREWLDV